MKKTALYPGSFDPFTIAHEQIVLDALTFFDKVVIAIGTNVAKNYLLSVEKRIELIEKVFSDRNLNVKVVNYNTLTTDYCAQNNISHIVRGVRNFADFEFESTIESVNKMLMPSLKTIYLRCDDSMRSVSSSAVRELLKFGADCSIMLPTNITTDDLK